MTITGFNKTIAEQHGYEIVKDSQGQEYSRRKGAATNSADTESSVNNVIEGTCGTAFVYINDVGYLKYNINTGYSVYAGAVYFDWQVSVIGPSPVNGTHKWSGGRALQTTWTGTQGGAVRKAGDYLAGVSRGYAVLYNGATCSAGVPTDRRYIN